MKQIACAAGARLELLEPSAEAFRRLLVLVGEQGDTVTCLHICGTIAKWLDELDGVA
jgi:hypothetical protein